MASELAEELSEDGSELQSVGLVETQHTMLFEPPHALRITGGKDQLGPIPIAYETYGTLNGAKDNAIYICHALTGDAHAAGRHEGSKKPGWWENFVGPGKGLNTDEYFVICANVLGGCQGTAGPGTINPESGSPYGLTFPFITIGDIVEVHSALVQHLGITQLLAVIGGSLGGMQVLEWTARFPQQMASAIVLASAARLSAQGIAFNAVGRRAISVDPQFHDGNYFDHNEVPAYGLALARMVAHITYLSESSIEMKFGRRLQDSDELAFELLKNTEFQIESYLHYQGKRFVERFDANSYLYLTRAMDYFDLADSYGSLREAFANTDARFLITSYNTDWLFPTSQSQELVAALIAERKHVSFIEFESPYGHDSFLLEAEQLSALVQPFLRQTHQSVQVSSSFATTDGDDK